jgi:LEA14-like dessication related protein
MHAMTAPHFLHCRRLAALACALLLAAALGGCASLTQRDPVRVHLAGVEALPGQGLELRFMVKLRVQNPNETPIDYDGVALDLEVNRKLLASGVSDQKGSVPRFGEAVLGVPVTISAFAAVRQALGLAEGQSLENMPYVLSGKLAGGPFGVLRFTDEGTLSLPGSGRPTR